MGKATPAGGEDERLETFWASSIYGMRTRKGLVELAHVGAEGERKWGTQITPEEARAFAASIVEAAEAADQDAFLVNFLQAKVHLRLEEAAAVLQEFRRIRDQDARA